MIDSHSPSNKMDAHLETKNALTDHKRVRTCPPPSLLRSGHCLEAPNNHLKSCEFCSVIIENTQTFAVNGGVEQEIIRRERCEPGQIWEVDPSLSSWTEDAFYLNSPFVLILDCTDHGVTVAQTYGDSRLKGPGDIELGKSTPGFAEPWNVYTLRLQDLKKCWSSVPLKVVYQVRLMLHHSFNDPLPSHIVQFRKLEVEVAAHVSSQSMHGFLGNLAKDTLLSFGKYQSPVMEVHEYASLIGCRLGLITNDNSRIYIPFASQRAKEVIPEFCLYFAPDDYLIEKVASSQGPEPPFEIELPGLVYILNDGLVEPSQPIRVQLLTDFDDAHVFITGRYDKSSLPKNIHKWQLTVIWQTNETHLVSQDVEEEDGDFSCSFERSVKEFKLGDLSINLFGLN